MRRDIAAKRCSRCRPLRVTGKLARTPSPLVRLANSRELRILKDMYGSSLSHELRRIR
jgi:hypothetical protein